MKPGVWVIAEDSGLEVEALGGLPGIHSARYAGPHARDSENLAKLLKMLQIRVATNRNARFLCTMVAFDPAGQEHIFTGELKGQIAKSPTGQMGFGYDPVFVPEGQTQSMAELGPALKINTHIGRRQPWHSFGKCLIILCQNPYPKLVSQTMSSMGLKYLQALRTPLLLKKLPPLLGWSSATAN